MYTDNTKKEKENKLMGLAIALMLKNIVTKKAVPAIKVFACKECNTIASVSIIDNKIKVSACRCV